MGKKSKRHRKTIKLVNVMPKITLPLMSVEVMREIQKIGQNVKKVSSAAKKAFTR